MAQEMRKDAVVRKPEVKWVEGQPVVDSMIFERIIELETAIHLLQRRISGRFLTPYKVELRTLMARLDQLRENISKALAEEDA